MVVSGDTFHEFGLFRFEVSLLVSEVVEFVKVFFFVGTELFDFLNIFSDNFSISNIFALNLASLVNLSPLELILFNSDFELFSLSIKFFHFLIEIITRWLFQDFLGQFRENSVNSYCHFL